MRIKEKMAYYVLLVASFFLLLSVAIPHHHHSNGLPCIEWIFGASADHHSHRHTEDTGCTDHNQALNPTIDKHVIEHNLYVLLSPLSTLFEYTHTAPYFLLPNRTGTVYIESLHDVWIGKAKGLRAPPVTGITIA